MGALDFDASDDRWLKEQTEALTEWLEPMSPSEWAEQKRYLPPSVTPLAGPFRFDVAPYTREIVDCLGVDSPIREVTVEKGVQLALTTAVLENCLGYYIEHVRSAPMMLLTADDGLAKTRLDLHITPMLQHSKLDRLIQSNDQSSNRKSGKTEKRLSWAGGGFAILCGVLNPSNLSSVPIQILLRDEIDRWPILLKQSGDPITVSHNRTNAFEADRKILDLSTPLIKGDSKIHRRFLQGDQRYYFVCCTACGEAQVLKFRRTNEDGELTGIVWDTDDDGNLVHGSTRYLCKLCSHPHTNDDKPRLLSPKNGAQWQPTAKPIHPYHRSYHISALYSPFLSWDAIVIQYLKGYKPGGWEMRDAGEAQVFTNEYMAIPWEIRGEKVRFEQASSHRRAEYALGEVPNRWAEKNCGSSVYVLLCTVDVHADSLKVAVWGWCRDRRVLVIDYWDWEGDTEQIEDPETWGKLEALIDHKEYTADDGKTYRIGCTLIDSGYRTDQVYEFASKWSSGVYPIKGRDLTQSGITTVWFSEFQTKHGTRALTITVDLYKDRWSAALKRGWDGLDIQPVGHFNAPVNLSDKALKELTVESKRKKLHPQTRQMIGWVWHRPGNAANELWDLLMYANAGLDAIAYDVCVKQWGLKGVDWNAFQDACLNSPVPGDPKRRMFFRLAA